VKAKNHENEENNPLLTNPRFSGGKSAVQWQVRTLSTKLSVSKTNFLWSTLIRFQDILHHREESIADLPYQSESRPPPGSEIL
jgi:hypothetical protein